MVNKGTNNATCRCVERTYEMTQDGFMRFKLSKFGIYAVIINPNPDAETSRYVECGYFCQNHLTILILLCVLIVIITVIIYVLCICVKSNTLEANKVLSD